MISTIIIWNGHSNFMLQGDGVTILIDPYFEHNPMIPYGWESLPKPDLVLVTHDHGDHTGQAVDICKKTGAKLGCIVGTGEKFVRAGVPANQIINGIGFNIGGTVEVKGAYITMTEAFHSSNSGFPVGYIIKMPDGVHVYHSGDTGIFANMKVWGELYRIDVALLPIGGVFTMDARQAAMACSLLGAISVIPMHYGTFPLLEQTHTAFAEQLAKLSPDTHLITLEPGKNITIDPASKNIKIISGKPFK